MSDNDLAQPRAEAMHLRDGEGATEMMPSAPERDLFSFGVALSQLVEGLGQKVEFGLWSASRVGESLGNTVETMLGAVAGFFVAEPQMTAQQVHDTLQSTGNVEAQHMRAVAADVAIEAGAHEGRMLAMKTEQQTHDVRLAQTLGLNPTAEATIEVDQQVAERRLTISR
jgi:hypothetical protein